MPGQWLSEMSSGFVMMLPGCYGRLSCWWKITMTLRCVQRFKVAPLGDLGPPVRRNSPRLFPGWVLSVDFVMSLDGVSRFPGTALGISKRLGA